LPRLSTGVPSEGVVRSSSLYDYVCAQLNHLIPRFGLDDSQAIILQCYKAICRESLSIPLGRRPPEFSRINTDGTPFQFALSLGSWRPSLQFLGEVGVPGSSTADRIALTRGRLRTLASIFSVHSSLLEAWDILDRIASPGDSELLADYAGAYWIGVSFPRGDRPQLTIYVNMKWGSEQGRWARLIEFSSCFGILAHWQETEKLLRIATQPLGVAVTLSADNSLIGRIYVSAYGNQLVYYEQLIELVANKAFLPVFREYSEILLGEERQFPTRSVVCSFGIGSGAQPDFKFELCGHCLFANDKAGAKKCVQWLRHRNVDTAAYLDSIEMLSEGHLSETRVDQHCFVGLGCRRGETYSSIYLKPTTTSR
jgi:hypothetical protein